MKLTIATTFFLGTVLCSFVDFGDAKCKPTVNNSSGKEMEFEFFDGKDNSYLVPYSDKVVEDGDSTTGKCDSNGKDRCHVLAYYFEDGDEIACSGHIDMKCDDTYEFTDDCTYSK
eukprot:Awhi_evm1s5976